MKERKKSSVCVDLCFKDHLLRSHAVIRTFLNRIFLLHLFLFDSRLRGVYNRNFLFGQKEKKKDLKIEIN